MKSDLVDFRVELFHETPTAWKVRRVGSARPPVWVRKSDGEIYGPAEDGTRQLTVPRAVAALSGLRD